VNDFIQEGLQMKIFHHPNITGICWLRADVQMNTPLIILPFMERGDLKSYLRKSRPGKLPPEEAKVCETINCCYMGSIEPCISRIVQSILLNW
jgi:hypothetical protein